jgi:hypothetical protein
MIHLPITEKAFSALLLRAFAEGQAMPTSTMTDDELLILAEVIETADASATGRLLAARCPQWAERSAAILAELACR